MRDESIGSGGDEDKNSLGLNREEGEEEVWRRKVHKREIRRNVFANVKKRGVRKRVFRMVRKKNMLRKLWFKIERKTSSTHVGVCKSFSSVSSVCFATLARVSHD